MPRFVVFVRATSDSESGANPSAALLEAMSVYNSSLVSAGILQAADGLLSSSRDTFRIAFHDSSAATLRPGPFPTNELVSGWWVLKVKDVEEAVDWAKKIPFKEGGVVEVRRVAEAEDFGEALSEELREKDEEMRKKVEKLAKGE